MDEGEYVVAYVSWLVDRIEGCVWHRGSKSDCERVLRMTGAVVNPEVKRAEFVLLPAQQWDEEFTDDRRC